MKLPPRRSEDDIRHVAQEWVAGRVLSTDTVPADLINLVFMPVAFGVLVGYRRRQLPSLFVFGIIGEDHHIPGRGINGYPMFTSCRVWRRTDALRARDLAQRMQEAMDGIP